MSAELDFKTLFRQVRRIGEVEFDNLPKQAQPIVAGLLERKANYPAVAVDRKVCMTEIDPHGQSKQILLEQNGEYEVYNDGGMKRIVVDSIFDRMIRCVVQTYPVNAPIQKIREAKTAFRKKARARTPQELAGLKRGNERRRLEAQARRAAAKEAEAAG